ncbi:MAG: Eco29kI family restriction endonuclease [Rhodoglobus sp.]
MSNLAESIHTALLARRPVPLASLPTITGPGIYALYYSGDFPAYARLAASNADDQWAAPIYVGKAIPPGGRKGLSLAAGTTALASRLREHRKSIEASGNLSINDFSARWLVIEPVWIPLGENLMINRYAPVWNALIDGFGNHAPGAGRKAGRVPRWDVLHPGRGWSLDLAVREELADAVAQDAEEYLRQRIGN